VTYDPDRDPEATKFAANSLAAEDAFRHEREGTPTGEFIRTLAVAGAVWLGIVLLSGGNAYAVWFGWIAGLAASLVTPFVGRWLSGGPWRDPREVRIAEEREERRRSMATRGRWATDAELMNQARQRAAERSFPGSETPRE
jgi:type IV secretory pathway VirB2 component (pilin)